MTVSEAKQYVEFRGEYESDCQERNARNLYALAVLISYSVNNPKKMPSLETAFPFIKTKAKSLWEQQKLAIKAIFLKK